MARKRRREVVDAGSTQQNQTNKETTDTTSPTSTITTKTNQVGVGTLINNLPPPNFVVTDNSAQSVWTRATTSKGKLLFEAQEESFNRTIRAFMRRNMGKMPFCCDDDDGMRMVTEAIKQHLVVCLVEMSSTDFKSRLVHMCQKHNKDIQGMAQHQVKTKYKSK